MNWREMANAYGLNSGAVGQAVKWHKEKPLPTQDEGRKQQKNMAHHWTVEGWAKPRVQPVSHQMCLIAEYLVFCRLSTEEVRG